jgi:NADP-dependent aldehyde dehydrogenase
MLSEGIATRYWDGIATRAAIPGVSLPARGGATDARNAAQVTLFVTGAQTFLAETSLRDEIFGPSGIVVLVDDEKEFSQVLRALEGQLTVSIHSTDAEPLAVELVACAETVAGRIIFNGWPTGVEVGYVTVHGGPYPATTNGQTTSVGALAINRFLRPVSYQNAPGDFLASELKDRNPMGIWREIDGVGSRS